MLLGLGSGFRGNERSWEVFANLSGVLSPLPRGTRGVVVWGVEAGEAAEDAGLQRGDVIVSVNGEEPKSVVDFYHKMWAQGGAGATIPLEVQRETAGVSYHECFRKSNLRRTIVAITPNNPTAARHSRCAREIHGDGTTAAMVVRMSVRNHSMAVSRLMSDSMRWTRTRCEALRYAT